MQLVAKYRHLVYSIPTRIGLGAEEASEVFQTVFLNLIRHIDRLEQDQTLIPWLVTAARRQSWKVARGAARSTRRLEEATEDLPDPGSRGEDLESLERQVAVRAALDHLNARCRELLSSLFYSDPPVAYTEISRRMRIPVASIGPTRIRCLEKLKREIRKSGLF